MINILYIIPRLAKAGTEKHLLNLANGLAKEGLDITICCLFGLGELENEDREISCKLLCLYRKNVYDLRIIIDLYRLIRQERYDIVHSYLFGFHYLATIPAKVARVPVVISSRRELAIWKKWHHRLLENLSNLFTDKVVACSGAVKNFALATENLSEDKINTIYNGVSLEEFCPRPKNMQILNEFGFNENDKIIGMVANFSSGKGHDLLLETLAQVKKVYPQIKCVLVGEGRLRREIEKKVNDLKLDRNVKFAGQRDDISQLLSVLDVFVLTSVNEGLPNAILEAMACGLPVIATNVGGIPEVVEDGKSGILVEPKDYQRLADGIIKLITDENLRKEMGRYGRCIIEQKFSLERTIKDYENFYESLL